MAWPTYTNTEMSRPGSVNNGADAYALCLTQFAGEILASYARRLVVSNMVYHKQISHGRSYQFPLTGRAKARYLTTGQRVITDAIKNAQRTITVPGMVVSSTLFPEFEQLVMHADDRAIKAEELGKALAWLREIHTIMMLAKASHSMKVIDDDDQSNGKFITNDKFKMDAAKGSTSKVELAAALCEAIYMAQVAMDEADVDDDGRCLVLRPAERVALLEGVSGVSGYALSREYGGQGSYANGEINRIGGVEIIKSNAIPKTNVLAATEGYQYYNGDFSKLIGVLFRKEAVGCVELMGCSVEQEWDLTYQSTIAVAKHSYGLGVLRPECAIAFELDTLSN